jgi:hypothetical protein
MRVAFDSVTLGAYLHPEAKYPKPVEHIPQRLQLLVEELQAANAKIIIATPILSEFLVLADTDGPLYLSEIENNEVFEIQPFNTVAAIEAARALAKAMKEGDKKSGATGRWQVVKVDRQFVAIAKVNAVSTIYTDDEDVRKLAATEGIATKGMADLPVPPPKTGDLLSSVERPASGASAAMSDK